MSIKHINIQNILFLSGYTNKKCFLVNRFQKKEDQSRCIIGQAGAIDLGVGLFISLHHCLFLDRGNMDNNTKFTNSCSAL